MSCDDAVSVSLHNNSWQQIDDSISDESLHSDDLIVSFNIAYSAAREITLFKVKRNLLKSSPSILSDLLSHTSMAILAHDDQIVEYVMDRVSNAPINQRRLTVNLTLVDTPSGDAGGDDSDDVFESVPEGYVSLEILQGLETVKFDEKVGDKDQVEQCAICLDELTVGSEATKMPCSHFFHRDCIFRWLVKGNSCPLCRDRIH